MGREIKRVALDFDGKRGETWKGFLNPHHKPCPLSDIECMAGSTTGRAWLENILRFLALVGEEGQGPRRNGTYPHPYLAEFPQAVTTRGKFDMSSNDVRKYRCVERPKVLPPSKDLFDLVVKLTESEPGRIGIEGINVWKLEQKLFELAGVDADTWGVCPVCKGDGVDPACKEAYEAWESEDPPEGPGWQVWEHTSEGSPVSPVFATGEELIEWLVQPIGTDEAWADRGTYGDGSPYCYSEQGQKRKNAEAFVKGSGWVPSCAFTTYADGTVGEHFTNIEIAGMNTPDP
jgi:hypothetical protein